MGSIIKDWDGGDVAQHLHDVRRDFLDRIESDRLREADALHRIDQIESGLYPERDGTMDGPMPMDHARIDAANALRSIEISEKAVRILDGGIGVVSGVDRFGLSQQDIAACESECGSLFADDFKHFLSEFGSVRIGNIEISPKGTVRLTRELASVGLPDKYYAVSGTQTGVPVIMIHLQDLSGVVWLYLDEFGKKSIYPSFASLNDLFAFLWDREERRSSWFHNSV